MVGDWRGLRQGPSATAAAHSAGMVASRRELVGATGIHTTQERFDETVGDGIAQRVRT